MFERNANKKELKAVLAYLDKHQPLPKYFIRAYIPPTVYFKDRILGFFNEEALIERLCKRCLSQTTETITRVRASIY